MRSLVVYGVAMSCGLMIGLGATYFEFANKLDEAAASNELVSLQRDVSAAESADDSSSKGPVAKVIGGTSFDFGTIERTGTGKHTFQIRNDGDEVLTLRAGSTTCKCTLSDINKENYQPGETAEILVEWDANTSGPESAFEQAANIHTNDPQQPTIEFRIRGLITENLRAMPRELVMGSIPSNQGATTQFRLFGSRVEEIHIQQAEFEDPSTVEFFELDFQPLAEEEVANEAGADCGVLGILTVKSGLPLGPIRQTIRIKADVGKEVELAIPVMGRVSGDISITSPAKYDSSRNLLDLGVLGRSDGSESKLFVFVKGEQRRDVEFSIAQIEPEGYLDVEVGPPEETLNGRTIKRLITIRVPPGLEPINRLGGSFADYGHILIETTHPTSKQIPINVKFAIE